MSKKFVLATHNPGKLREFRSLLGDQPIEILSLAEFSIPSVSETGLTFVENAILKARQASLHSGLPSIADDSGLEVDALRGAPGVFSARYAGERASDEANNSKLLSELKGIDSELERSARFRCVMVSLRHADDPSPIIAQGVWEGSIALSCKGTRGFGYDPLFWVREMSCTAGELSQDEKNAVSHRGQALRSLVSQVFVHYGYGNG